MTHHTSRLLGSLFLVPGLAATALLGSDQTTSRANLVPSCPAVGEAAPEAEEAPEVARLRAALREGLALPPAEAADGPEAQAAASGSEVTLFVPVVLSAPGAQGSYFTSELTLTNKGTTPASLELTYAASAGGGSGTVTDTLGAGQQRILPDAIAYLRGLGLPIANEGSRVGTLRIRFSGLSSPAEAFATVRTATPTTEGRAGLAYAGVNVLALPRPVRLPSGAVSSGTYASTNSGTTDVFPAPAPAGPYGASLTAFGGRGPNGTWSLYAVDDTSSDTGSFANGWCLQLVTTSETWEGCNAAAVKIPASGTGSSSGSPADVYPSAIQVSGVGGTIQKAVVRLRGVSHAYVSDLDVLLTGPDGTSAVVVSDTGGRATSANLSFDDVGTPILVGGLRQNAQDRSNVAIQNAGAPGDGDVVVKTTVYSGDPARPLVRALSPTTIPPGGFFQYSGILGEQGLENGWVVVEQMAGTAPVQVYGVVNDMGNSDGSFVPGEPAARFAGVTAVWVPVVVESGAFTSELVLANLGTSDRTVSFTFWSDGLTSSTKSAAFSVSVRTGEQKVIPNLMQYMREQGVSGMPAAGTSLAGSLKASLSSGDFSSLFVGARTSAPGSKGRYGLFYTAAPSKSKLSSKAWLFGLQQNSENRTNLALVNSPDSGGGTDVFKLELFDGATGALAGTKENVSLTANQWTQFGSILSDTAPGSSQAWARITRSSGSYPFLAYAVLNDGAGPGLRSGDGAFVWAVPDCTYTVSSGRTLGWSGGSTSFDVSSSNGCWWSAESDTSWLTIPSSLVVNGSGSVSYTVAPNPSASTRSGTITAAGKSFVVTQLGNSPGTYDGVWTGTTSQSKPIGFTIVANEVTAFALSFSASVGQCSISGSFTAETSPRPVVVNGKLSTSYAVSGGGGGASVGVSATFSGPKSASGSWSVNVIIAGSTICIGIPGSSASWTATRP